MKLLKLVPDTTNIAFLKWRNIAIGISLLLMIASVAVTVQRGLNFGVDFIGGQMIQVTFTESKDAPIAELRQDFKTMGMEEATIQRFGKPNEVSIRMKLQAEEGDAVAGADPQTKAIVAMLGKNYKDARIDGVDAVSGKVSEELLSKGVYSLIFALLAISLYIWIRFEWQFGVGALFALFHDVVLTFGFFAVTQLEFNLSIVAALLTIIGYSLNDTIVIFDRIRENLKKYRKMDIISLLDLSVNETLARTVMTSLTMVLALAALLIWGPSVIFGFTAAMLFGVVVGTYSSVYMASPVLIWLKVGPDSFIPAESSNDKAEKIGGPEQVG